MTLLSLLACPGVRGASLWSTSRVDPDLDPSELQTPLLLQHASDDASTRHANLLGIHTALRALHEPGVFHTVAGNQHFFQDADFSAAVARDLAFFSGLMRPPAALPR